MLGLDGAVETLTGWVANGRCKPDRPELEHGVGTQVRRRVRACRALAWDWGATAQYRMCSDVQGDGSARTCYFGGLDEFVCPGLGLSVRTVPSSPLLALESGLCGRGAVALVQLGHRERSKKWLRGRSLIRRTSSTFT